MTKYTQDLSDEDRESILNSPDLQETMEEMTVDVLEELIQQHQDRAKALGVDPESLPPQIPAWFQNAYNNF